MAPVELKPFKSFWGKGPDPAQNAGLQKKRFSGDSGPFVLQLPARRQRSTLLHSDTHRFANQLHIIFRRIKLELRMLQRDRQPFRISASAQRKKAGEKRLGGRGPRRFRSWGIEEVEFVDTSKSEFIPKLLKLPFMVGRIGILHGKK